MDSHPLVGTAEDEFEQARLAALGAGRFWDKAERIRNHLRPATVCLVRCAAPRTCEDRATVGQRTLQREGPQRGRKVGEEGAA
jgi:hypothetical protein